MLRVKINVNGEKKIIDAVKIIIEPVRSYDGNCKYVALTKILTLDEGIYQSVQPLEYEDDEDYDIDFSYNEDFKIG